MISVITCLIAKSVCRQLWHSRASTQLANRTPARPRALLRFEGHQIGRHQLTVRHRRPSKASHTKARHLSVSPVFAPTPEKTGCR